MAVAACPAQRALWRMPARSAGTGSCRQHGGLRCPGGAQPHALWAGTTASHRSKLMPFLPPSLPPPLLPTRSSHHLSGHRGGSPGGARWRRDTGACHLLPAPAGVEEDGAEQPGLPHPRSLPDWGRVWAPREGKSVSKNHSHLQGGSGGVFEIA